MLPFLICHPNLNSMSALHVSLFKIVIWDAYRTDCVINCTGNQLKSEDVPINLSLNHYLSSMASTDFGRRTCFWITFWASFLVHLTLTFSQSRQNGCPNTNLLVKNRTIMAMDNQDFIVENDIRRSMEEALIKFADDLIPPKDFIENGLQVVEQVMDIIKTWQGDVIDRIILTGSVAKGTSVMSNGWVKLLHNNLLFS